MTEVIGQMSRHSPAFATLWARYEVRPRTSEEKRLWHPQVGELRLHYQAFTVTGAPGQQLFVYSARPGSPSDDALRLLRSSADQAVGGPPHRRHRVGTARPRRTSPAPVEETVAAEEN